MSNHRHIPFNVRVDHKLMKKYRHPSTTDWDLYNGNLTASLVTNY